MESNSANRASPTEQTNHLLFVYREGPPKPRQKDEVKTIQSFVMHRYNRKAQSTSVTWRKRGPAKQARVSTEKRQDSGQKCSITDPKSLSSARSECSARVDCLCYACMASRVKHEPKAELLNPRSYHELFAVPIGDIGSGGGDPFAATAVTLTPALTSHLHYFVVHIGQECWTAVQGNGENPHVTQFLQFAFEDPACLHSSAAVATAHQAIRRRAFPDKVPANDPRRIEHNLQKSKAIRFVNDKLSKAGEGTKDEAISAVAMLAAAEAFTGRFDELRLHLSGLKEMLRIRGGIRNIFWIVALNVTVTDVKTAMTTQTQPRFEMLHPPDEMAFSASIDSLLKSPFYPYFYSFGSRLTKGGLRPLFPPKVLETFEDLRYTAIFWEICKRDSQYANSDDFKQFAIRELRVEHQLTYLSHYDCAVDKSTTTFIKACCVAASVFTNTALWVQAPGSAILLGLVDRLQRILTDDLTSHSTWAAIHGVLLWILFLGAHAAEGQPQRAWFTREIGRVGATLALNTWEEVLKLLIPCTYSDRFHRVPFMLIWEESRSLI